MFSRGNWSIIGIDTKTKPAFEATLNDAKRMLAYSQLAADAVARSVDTPAVGINPFSRPRLDEDSDLSIEQRDQLVAFKAMKPEDRSDDADILLSSSGAFRFGTSAFSIAAPLPVYAFWFCFNEFKDVGDRNSLKEDISYRSSAKPYKFLSVGEKKGVDNETKSLSSGVRKQFPVIIDFTDGKVYAEVTNKNLILMLKGFLGVLGIESFDVAWKFGEYDWIRKFLKQIHENTNFRNDFKKRAEDTTRFKDQEVEQLDDREMEKIVSGYFAMTEDELAGWVGLTTPAAIRLYPSSSTVVAPTPTTATLLLAATQGAHIYTAGLDFQERITTTNKEGEEKSWRNTIFTLDLSDGINELDSGAALLRGFDLPGFKKGIQKDIRKTKNVPEIARFWLEWLMGTKSAIRTFTETVRLALDLEHGVGIQRLYETQGTDEVIEPSPDLHTQKAIELFPDFSDPATTKEEKIELRRQAKLINLSEQTTDDVLEPGVGTTA